MNKIIKIVGLVLILGVASCSEEITPEPFTFSKFFTGENSKTWKVTLFEETLNGKVVDRFTIGCVNDDRYIFFANPERRTEFRAGSSRCFDPAEPALIIDSWSYQSGTATLTMLLPIFADVSLPFIVKEINDDDMELEIFFEGNTGSYRVHFDAIDED
ncbi:MAG TPA: hypothetical protein VFU05_03345 [Cyclobacteriaceae bacterium]|nr:hypothetical protein [Cyclobacteriaceae bacterium]